MYLFLGALERSLVLDDVLGKLAFFPTHFGKNVEK